MALAHVWRAFNRLRRRKGSNGFSVGPLEWPDIDAFLRLSRTKLTTQEIEIVEELDDLYRAEQAKAEASTNKKE